MRLSTTLLAAGIAIACDAMPCRAVIIYDSPNQNTVKPVGEATGFGWDYGGIWSNFAGTAIAPQWFITATHTGGTPGPFGTGTKFTYKYDGLDYYTTHSVHIPGTDLQLWHISGTFPAYAQLYQGSDEVGKPLYTFGTGVPRGDKNHGAAGEVKVGGVLRGWKTFFYGDPSGFVDWSATNSWGENDVDSIVNISGIGPSLAFDFDPTTGQNEAHLAAGDSGGSVFIQEDGVWRLAGVNEGTDGNWSTDGTNYFQAAIFNRNGLYETGVSGGPYTDSDPASAYSARISAHLAFINATTGIPEPSGALMILAASGLTALRRRSAK